MLDIPCILLRTDFRPAGEDAHDAPFDLMASYYPRCTVLKMNAMQMYGSSMSDTASNSIPWQTYANIDSNVLQSYNDSIAKKVIDAFEPLLQQQSIAQQQFGDVEKRQKLIDIYCWAIAFPGSQYDEFVVNNSQFDNVKDFCQFVIDRKIEKGLQ
jgi:hypothetical protein